MNESYRKISGLDTKTGGVGAAFKSMDGVAEGRINAITDPHVILGYSSINTALCLVIHRSEIKKTKNLGPVLIYFIFMFIQFLNL